MTGPRIEIVIDELVLRGVAPSDAHAVAAAVESELGLLGSRWSASGGSVFVAREESSRRLPAVGVRTNSSTAVGDAVAGAVWSAVAPRSR
jgi:hypothetical protein